MDDSISVTQYLQYFAVLTLIVITLSSKFCTYFFKVHHVHEFIVELTFRFTMSNLVSMKRYDSISHNITYLTKFDMNL